MTENVNRNIPPELSDDDAELLSAYMDDMLTAAERDTLEKRLADDAFLRRELQAMRQTVEWLNQMPGLQAPRNFTINAEDVAQDPPPNVVVMLRRNWWLSAAAAAFVIVLFGAVFVFSTLSVQNDREPAAQSGGDAAHSDTQGVVGEVANAPSSTTEPTQTSTSTTTALPTVNILATQPMGVGATTSALSTPTFGIGANTDGVESLGDESDDVVTEEQPEPVLEIEESAAEDSADLSGMAQGEAVSLTATALAELFATAESLDMAEESEAAMAPPSDDVADSALAQGGGSVLTATMVMETGAAETSLFAATEPPVADVSLASPMPMTQTPIPTSLPPMTGTPMPQPAVSDTRAMSSEPNTVESQMSAVETLRMTATAMVQFYGADIAGSSTLPEATTEITDAVDGTSSNVTQQQKFAARRLFLYIWIRLLEYLETAP